MCKVDSVLNHVKKAASYAEKDSSKGLYSKTVDKYSGEVVSAMEALADALSVILGSKVSISVDGKPVDEALEKGVATLSERSQAVRAAIDTNQKAAAQNARIKKLESRMDALEQSAQTVVSQNDAMLQMFANLSKLITPQTVISSGASAASAVEEKLKKKKSKKAEAADAQTKQNRAAEQTKPRGNKTAKAAKEKPAASSKSSKASSTDPFSGSKIKKAFHKYYDDQADAFYKVLKKLTSARAMSVEMIANSVLPWFDCRFMSKTAPVNMNGKPSYSLYQFPRYLAYYVGICAHNWNDYKFYNPRSDFQEFADAVYASDEDNPMIAPNFLIAKSDEHVELDEKDVVCGYWYWLMFVKYFNQASREMRAGVTLEPAFFTSKMHALGYGSEDLLFKLQNIKDPDQIDIYEYQKTGKW